MFDFSKEPGKQLTRLPIHTKVEPLVSVVTPFYNAGKYFEQTYNCVINQTFPWFEWIIVNDGSTNEEDIRILNRFARTDERIVVLEKSNGGIASARNLGIEKSNTDMIIPLDADDLIAPTYVETLYWALACHPDTAWAYTDTVGFGAENYLWKKRFSAMEMKENNLLACTAAIRKRDLKEVGNYQTLAKHFNEDWYTWLSMLSMGKAPVHVAEYGFWYRRHNNGVLSRVKTDEAIHLQAEEIIKKAAQKVTGEVACIEYPREQRSASFKKPVSAAWKNRLERGKKRRILLLLPWLEMGGADLFNLNVVKRIDPKRFEISIITTQPSENSWNQRFEEYTSEIFHLPNFLDIEDYPEFISYFIESRGIDVLFLSNSYYGYQILPWIRKEFPELAIVDYVHMEEWYWRNGGFARISGMMGDILEHTYVCNEKTRKVIAQRFKRGEEAVDTLYIGVDHEEFDPQGVEKGAVRKRFGIQEERPIILFPCRIHPQKRPFLMLQIAKELKKRISNVAFVVVGDGPQYDELVHQTNQLGLDQCVYFAGRQMEMKPFYRDASVTLICSLKEGLALTAYESLAMETPVVTSDVGGQAELVDEHTGVVLPLMQSEDDLDVQEYSLEEIKQYADALEELLRDTERYVKLCENCRRRIVEHFSLEIMIGRVEEIFEKLCSDSSMKKRRCEVAETLKRIESVIDEGVTLANEYSLVELNSESVWKSREYFRKKYEEAREYQEKSEEIWQAREYYRRLYEQAAELSGNQMAEASPMQLSGTDAEQELREIKAMRLWRVIEGYRHFMDETKIGQMMSKLRDAAWPRREKR